VVRAAWIWTGYRFGGRGYGYGYGYGYVGGGDDGHGFGFGFGFGGRSDDASRCGGDASASESETWIAASVPGGGGVMIMATWIGAGGHPPAAFRPSLCLDGRSRLAWPSVAQRDTRQEYTHKETTLTPGS
jgi:hypothetical protein